MLTVYSIGDDPGLDIVRRIWPEEDPFQSNRHLLIKALKAELSATHPDLIFDSLTDDRSRFRFHMHSLPSDFSSNIGTSALMAAWNAAVYVAQIEDERVGEAMRSDRYLEAARAVLEENQGLWFQDESFIVTRRA